jgi:endonuclease YncB( thermonuclease family)
LDDVDVNQQMITDGYAVGYHGQSKDDIEGQHLVNRDRLLTENKVQLDPDFGK